MHITNIEVPEEIDRLEKMIEEATHNKLQAAQSQNFESAAAFRDQAQRLAEQLDEAKASWEKSLSMQKVLGRRRQSGRSGGHDDWCACAKDSSG